jgi:mannose/fructose/N-acetylgalactosamine-specific phosphotransferase system component IIC
MMDPLSAFFLLLLGGWVAVDGTAAGQFMISRPLVAGTITGFVLGDPWTGALVGGVLELLHLGALPVGGARIPEAGPPAIPAVVAAVLLGGGGGMAVALGWGVVGSWIGGASMSGHRRGNERRTQGVVAGEWAFPRLARAHWTSLGMDGLRGAALTGLGLVVVAGIPAAWVQAWPVSREWVLAAGVLGGCVSLGRVATAYLGVRPGKGTALLLLGAGLGILLGLVGGGA